jgi:hypothetical protein
VLKKTGSFYYHCDWHASHYVKVMLDQKYSGKTISRTKSSGGGTSPTTIQKSSAAFTMSFSITSAEKLFLGINSTLPIQKAISNRITAMLMKMAARFSLFRAVLLATDRQDDLETKN